MYTLAGAASTFVAIIAGFYTTKIFSITADINHLKNKSKQIELEIDWKSQNVQRLEEQINSKIDKDNEKHVNYFLEEMKSEYSQRIESFDQILQYYETFWEKKPFENIVKKLKNRYEPFRKEFNKELDENQELLKKSESTPYSPFAATNETVIARPLYHVDETARIIESDRSIEEENRFLDLKKEFEREQGTLDFLNKQFNEYSEEMNALVYPNMKFGFISFALFAFLGVIIPLTSNWWDDYLTGYSDIFAFVTFVIGLLLTFVYIYFEIFVSGKRTVNK